VQSSFGLNGDSDPRGRGESAAAAAAAAVAASEQMKLLLRWNLNIDTLVAGACAAGLLQKTSSCRKSEK
jgi:hypothetical protein